MVSRPLCKLFRQPGAAVSVEPRARITEAQSKGIENYTKLEQLDQGDAMKEEMYARGNERSECLWPFSTRMRLRIPILTMGLESGSLPLSADRCQTRAKRSSVLDWRSSAKASRLSTKGW